MNKVTEDKESAVPDSHPNEKTGQHKDDDEHEHEHEDVYEDDDDQKSIDFNGLGREEKNGNHEFIDKHHTSSLTMTESDFFEDIATGRWSVNTNNRTNGSNGNSNSNSNSIAKQSRRTSQVSDITFESDEQLAVSDTDAQTTDSNDSFNWKDYSSEVLHASNMMGSERFAPNETEEGQDGLNRLSGGSSHRSSSANTDPPVIPRRRVSVSYMGVKKAETTNTNTNTNTNTMLKNAENRTPGDRRVSDPVPALRGNSAAPTIPRRSSSHTSKLTSGKNNWGGLVTTNNDNNNNNASSPTNTASPSGVHDKNQNQNQRHHQHQQQQQQQQQQQRHRSSATSTRGEDPPVLPERRASHSISEAAASASRFGYCEANGVSTPLQAVLSCRRLDGNETDASDDTNIDTDTTTGGDSVEGTPPSAPTTGGGTHIHIHTNSNFNFNSTSNSNNNNNNNNNQLPSIPLRKYSDSLTDARRSPTEDSARPHDERSNQPPTLPMRKESSHRTISSTSSSPLSSNLLPPAIPMRQSSESEPVVVLLPSNSDSIFNSNNLLLLEEAPSPPASVPVDAGYMYSHDVVSNQPPTIPTRKDSGSNKSVT